MFVYSAVSFIVAVSILVLFHEGGHFVVARTLGIKVMEFSIGFGTRILSWDRGRTRYSLRLIPLGGFVKFLGEDDDSIKDGFLAQPLWKKALVVSAGPIMNLLIAIPLIAMVFFFNGFANLHLPVVGGVIRNFPAEKSGIKAGDRIISIDGVEVHTWRDISGYIHKIGNKEITVVIKRRGKILQFRLRPRFDPKRKVSLIGIYPVLEKYNLLSSIYNAIKYVFGLFGMMVVFLWKAIFYHIPLDLKGPVAIAYMAGKAAARGWVSFFSFTAFLSVNLALINLFPFPALDGGRLLFYGVELLSGKRINPEKIEYIHLVGFWILIVLVVYITFRDIISLR